MTTVWIWLIPSPNPDTVPYYAESSVIYTLAVVVELLVEPLWICAQQFRLVRTKVGVLGKKRLYNSDIEASLPFLIF